MAIWQELHRSRSAGPMGMCTIGWAEFHGYVAVTGDRLSPGDIAAIRVIEDCFFESRTEAEERRAKAAAKN